jgi:hypothetical protein
LEDRLETWIAADWGAQRFIGTTMFAEKVEHESKRRREECEDECKRKIKETELECKRLKESPSSFEPPDVVCEKFYESINF